MPNAKDQLAADYSEHFRVPARYDEDTDCIWAGVDAGSPPVHPDEWRDARPTAEEWAAQRDADQRTKDAAKQPAASSKAGSGASAATSQTPSASGSGSKS